MNSASKKSYFFRQVHWRRGVSLPGNLTTKRKRAKQWRRITKKEKRYMKYLCQTKSNSGMDGNMSPSCLTPNKRRGAEVYRVSGHAGRAWWQEQGTLGIRGLFRKLRCLKMLKLKHGILGTGYDLFWANEHACLSYSTKNCFRENACEGRYRNLVISV